jgi:hypothetical protein
VNSACIHNEIKGEYAVGDGWDVWCETCNQKFTVTWSSREEESGELWGLELYRSSEVVS